MAGEGAPWRATGAVFGGGRVAENCPKRTPNGLNVPSYEFLKYVRLLFYAHAKFPRAEAAAEWPDRVRHGARAGWCLERAEGRGPRRAGFGLPLG